MREGTFKIDRAIREIEKWHSEESIWMVSHTLERVLEMLREVRDTDAGAVDPDATPFEMPEMEQRS